MEAVRRLGFKIYSPAVNWWFPYICPTAYRSLGTFCPFRWACRWFVHSAHVTTHSSNHRLYLFSQREDDLVSTPNTRSTSDCWERVTITMRGKLTNLLVSFFITLNEDNSITFSNSSPLLFSRFCLQSFPRKSAIFRISLRYILFDEKTKCKTLSHWRSFCVSTYPLVSFFMSSYNMKWILSCFKLCACHCGTSSK